MSSSKAGKFGFSFTKLAGVPTVLKVGVMAHRDLPIILRFIRKVSYIS